MTDHLSLTPATDLAARNRSHLPNESAAYRTARNALLAEEIELRRHIERVAAMRRALPPGGAVTREYLFVGEHGPADLAALFADKQTLVVYSMMFGPERDRACPVCTSFLSGWDGAAVNLRERVALAVVARSPLRRLADFRRERGWQHLPFFSDTAGDFTRDYVTPEDGDVPGLNVFTRRRGAIEHFWRGEISDDMADPGQDSRGSPEIDLLWTFLDLAPEGRGTDWYPRLEYTPAPLINIAQR